MKRLLLFLCVFTSLNMLAKTNLKEFEGVIHYTKYTKTLNKSTASKKHEQFLKDKLGEKSDFYYKNGMHLWDRFLTGGKELYYKNSKFVYVKENNDYKIWRKNDVFKKNEVINSIKILSETDTVLGYKCQILEVKSTFLPVTRGRKWLRRFYFNQENFFVDYKYLKKYRLNSQNEIYKLIQAIPLRIYVEINGVILDYVATNVEFKNLDEKLFERPPTTK